MSEYDPFEDRLADALRRRSGTAAGSVASAHEAVLTRASHIRRRRAAVVGGVAMVALFVGGATLLRGGAGDTLAPADSGVPLPSIPDDTVTSTQPSTATEQPVSVATTAPTTTNDSATAATTIIPTGTSLPSAGTDATSPATTPPEVSATLVGTAPASDPPSTAHDTITSTTDDVSTTTIDTSSSTSTSEAAPPPIAPFTRTYQSAGGSIAVDWNGSALALLGVSPAAGFEPEIEDEQPRRIRVRFRSDDDDARIEIRVDDGTLSESIS